MLDGVCVCVCVCVFLLFFVGPYEFLGHFCLCRNHERTAVPQTFLCIVFSILQGEQTAEGRGRRLTRPASPIQTLSGYLLSPAVPGRNGMSAARTPCHNVTEMIVKRNSSCTLTQFELDYY